MNTLGVTAVSQAPRRWGPSSGEAHEGVEQGSRLPGDKGGADLSQLGMRRVQGGFSGKWEVHQVVKNAEELNK